MSQYLRTFFISDIYRPESVLPPVTVATLGHVRGRGPAVRLGGVERSEDVSRRQYRFRLEQWSDNGRKYFKIEMY